MELVNCAPPPNMGCEGGYMDVAMQWVANQSSGGGLNSEHYYKYYAHDGRCDYRKERVSVVSLDGYEHVPVSSPAMIAAISRGPVSIGIDASSIDFQNYDRGTFSSCAHDLKRIDHGVLAVGYWLDAGNASGHIIVKNSWGGSWGMRGYVNIRYDAKLDNGTCGMNLQAVLPVGAKMKPATPTPPPPPKCADGGLLKPAIYCDYNTTCCCKRKSIFGSKCAEYSCCPTGVVCPHPAASAFVEGVAAVAPGNASCYESREVVE